MHAPPLAPARTAPRSPEAFIARREAARRFLEGCGARPYLLNHDVIYPVPNAWQVAGWAGTFGDHDLIALAEELGMAHG
ncbi:MAG TPA: hypothetical protein VGF77_08340 [Allosphingosinicella sp.]